MYVVVVVVVATRGGGETCGGGETRFGGETHGGEALSAMAPALPGERPRRRLGPLFLPEPWELLTPCLYPFRTTVNLQLLKVHTTEMLIVRLVSKSISSKAAIRNDFSEFSSSPSNSPRNSAYLGIWRGP